MTARHEFNPTSGDLAVLDHLLSTPGSPAPGRLTFESLAQRAAVDISAARSAVQRLSDAGCEIDVHPQQGVRLVRSGLSVWSDYLAWNAKPQAAEGWGAAAGGETIHNRRVEVYRATASTQDAVRRMMDGGGAMVRDERNATGASGAVTVGPVATTDHQTAGRGRLGRKWLAPPGSAAMFSASYTLSAPPDLIVLAAGVAIARGIELATHRHVQPRIKWPNDLIVDGRKLAGILVETHQRPAPISGVTPGVTAIIGVGVNVALLPAELAAQDATLPARITSLSVLGCSVDRLHVLRHCLNELDAAMRALDGEALLHEWRQRSDTIGTRVRLMNDGRLTVGQVVDLDPFEGLIVRTDQGTVVHLPAATTSTA